MSLSSPPVLLPSSPTSERHIYREQYEPIESIETDSDASHSGRNSSGLDEAVFDATLDDDHDARQSSPDTSPQHSDTDAHEKPMDTDNDDCISELQVHSREPSVIYTPSKQRSPFRNPSSVRALQLDTTPPHLRSGSARSKNQYRMSGVSGISRCSTPKSVRSMHSARSPRSQGSPTKQKKEHPLVLLHVTLLPVGSPYSLEVMEAVLPAYIIDNWKLLREKVTDTVLERGILIPHPREDYDVMEERLLESLELKLPRILKCGHFHLSEEEEADIFADEDEYDSADDADICDDCGRRIRDGLYGAGSGQRRWDMKIYASNGLMRAGAWSAAWREMERVDVEILPWIDDTLRRELDLRREAERAETTTSTPPHPVVDATEYTSSPPSPPSKMDEQRRREIYGEDAQAFVDGFVDSPPSRDGHKGHARQQPTQQAEPPLLDMLSNYVQLLMRDRRNLAIAALSAMVLFFALGVGRSSSLPVPSQPADVIPQGTPSIMRQAAVTTETVYMPAPGTISSSTAMESEVTQVPEVSVVEDQEQSETGILSTLSSSLPEISNSEPEVLVSEPTPSEITAEVEEQTSETQSTELEKQVKQDVDEHEPGVETQE